MSIDLLGGIPPCIWLLHLHQQALFYSLCHEFLDTDIVKWAFHLSCPVFCIFAYCENSKCIQLHQVQPEITILRIRVYEGNKKY